MDVPSFISPSTWVSSIATMLALGLMATKFGTRIDPMDPVRQIKYGPRSSSWFLPLKALWHRITRFPPAGPGISVDLVNGIDGQNSVHISRLPLTSPVGQSAWSLLLAVIHPACQKSRRCAKSLEDISIPADKGREQIGNGSEQFSLLSSETWPEIISSCPIVVHKERSCTAISRATLLALLCLTNARPVFCYCDASGYRAAYASYCGQWRIEWPIGDHASVFFSAHDLHASFKDVFPASFEQRIDKCLQILAGVVASEGPNRFKCAFPGRKSTGTWRLQYAPKAFGGAHSGRHFYNMIGGKSNEVDYLFMTPESEKHESLPESSAIQTIYLPNKEDGAFDVVVYIGDQESAVLDEALDSPPWSFLSWSIHQGLHDILIAYSKQRMDSYRTRLANTLRLAVLQHPERLIARGWDSQFVRQEMADMVSSAVCAGQGNSGDAVRAVTDIAASLWDGDASALDKTDFWRKPVSTSDISFLSPMDVNALVKCFVLKWSVQLDYQMYHDLPLDLYLG